MTILLETITRPVTRKWRICRSVATPQGIATRDIPAFGGDSLILHALTAESALDNARQLLPAYLHKQIVALSWES